MYIWPLVLKRDLSLPWAISDILQWNNKKDVKRFYIYRMLPGAYKTRAVVVVCGCGCKKVKINHLILEKNDQYYNVYRVASEAFLANLVDSCIRAIIDCGKNIRE